MHLAHLCQPVARAGLCVPPAAVPAGGPPAEWFDTAPASSSTCARAVPVDLALGKGCSLSSVGLLAGHLPSCRVTTSVSPRAGAGQRIVNFPHVGWLSGRGTRPPIREAREGGCLVNRQRPAPVAGRRQSSATTAAAMTWCGADCLPSSRSICSTGSTSSPSTKVPSSRSCSQIHRGHSMKGAPYSRPVTPMHRPGHECQLRPGAASAVPRSRRRGLSFRIPGLRAGRAHRSGCRRWS